MKYEIQKDDVILLLGAGASQEAGIPITSEMIEKIESELDSNWKEYQGLYNFLKDQVKKVSGGNLNVEDLVNTLDELLLLLKKQHPLSPFQLSWIEFIENVGYTVDVIEKFKDSIIESLRKWIVIDNYVSASYYRDIASFQRELSSPLRVFTLNYDLCIESICDRVNEDGVTVEMNIERGFGRERYVNEPWHWSRFKIGEGEPDPDIYLYKLHGSIDWERDENDKIIHRAPARVLNHEVIFGTRQKVKAYDPYLFFIYEFREHCINSKVIVVSGYGFCDDHINKILKQALTEDNSRILCVNMYSGNPEERSKELSERLGLSSNGQIKVECGMASLFFSKHLNLEYLNGLFPDEDLPF